MRKLRHFNWFMTVKNNIYIEGLSSAYKTTVTTEKSIGIK